MAPPAATRKLVREEVENFLDRTTTNAEDIAHLLRYVRASPDRTSTLSAMPADDMAERLAFAKKALRCASEDPNDPLTENLRVFDMSLICALDIDDVRSLGRMLYTDGTWELRDFSKRAQDLTKRCMISTQY